MINVIVIYKRQISSITYFVRYGNLNVAIATQQHYYYSNIFSVI